jgi:diguanylate cyclase (GGDEF)-like protein
MAGLTGRHRFGVLALMAALAAYWAILAAALLSSLRLPFLSHQEFTFVLAAAGLPLTAICGLVLWRAAKSGVVDLAFKDDLTGLPNRRAFIAEAERVLHGRKTGAVGMVLYDVDGLKVLNDECGHQAGDELLLRVAKQIERLARPGCQAYRVGGDEFALFVDRSRGGHVADVVRAIGPASVRFDACGHQHELQMSSGFASSAEGESFDSLFQRADQRLCQSKQRLYDSGVVPNRRTLARHRALAVAEQDTEPSIPPPQTRLALVLPNGG